MLDLDFLAEKCARRLNQTADLWRTAVWSDEFQKFSSHLTDGEVEQLLSWCPSVEHLRALPGFLADEAKALGLPLFPCLLDLARRAAMTPEDWIRSCLPLDQP